MPKLTMVEALNQALDQEMQKNDKVMLLGEDIGKDGGVFRVTEGLYKKYGGQRVVDTPLSESGIIGASLGLAASGMRPVAEIQFSGFLSPGFDQLISHVSRLRNRSRGRFTCPMVVRTPYGGGIRALEHHAESMEACYAHVQGLVMVVPSTPYNAKGLLLSAIRSPDPVLFFEPKKVYRAIKMDVPEKEYTVPLSKADVVKEGSDVTIITWGAMLKTVMDSIEESDFDVEVVDLQTIKPFDEKTVLDSVKKTGRAVVVHEAPRTGGWGAEIIARIQEKALLSLQAPVKRVTGFDVPFPYFKLEKPALPSKERVLDAIDQVMNF